MACDVTVNLFNNTFSGKKVLKLISKSGEPVDPIDGLALAIKEDPEFKEQFLKIIQKVDNIDVQTPTWRKDKDTSVNDSLHGNISYTDLFEVCPIEGGWPDISELEDIQIVDKNILFTEYVKSGANALRGIVHDTITGKNIFVLNKENINSFRNYLLNRLAINKIKEEDIPEELKAISDHFKSSPKKVLEEYLKSSTSSKYDTNIKVKDQKINIKSFLKNYLRLITDRSNKRKYSNELVNIVAGLTEYNTYTKNYGIKYRDLFKTFSEYYKNEEKTPKEVQDILNEIEKEKSLTGTQKIELVDKIIEIVKSLDPEFTFKRIENYITPYGKIIFTNPVTSLNDRYGSTIESFTNHIRLVDENFLGYRIYQFKQSDNSPVRFFYTQGRVTKETQGHMYATLEEVQEKIKQLDTPLFKTNVFLKQKSQSGIFLTRTGQQFLTEGQIIRTLDIELPTVTLSQQEQDIYYSKSEGLQLFYRHFYKLFNNPSYIRIENGRYVGSFVDKINTSEKAASFLYLINSKENKPKKAVINQEYFNMVDQVINKITSAKSKYYFVNQFYRNNTAQLIEVKDDFDGFTEEDSRPIPTISILKAIQKAIEDKLKGTGIQVKLLSQKDLIQDLKNQGVSNAENIGTNKAFLYGNTIYINKTIADVTDPLHEYAHVFLGILKAKNYNLYRKLILEVLESNKKQAEGLLEKAKTLYPNLSQYDLEEEVVATMYGKYIINNKYLEFTKVEELNKEVKKEARKTIFDQSNSVISFDRKLGILAQLNTDVQYYLLEQNKESIIEDFKNSKEFRQAAQAIQNDLEKNLLEEECE